MYRTLVRSIAFAAGHPRARGRQVSVIGFSMGAHWAFWLSRDPTYKVRKVAAFYGLRNIDFSGSLAEYQIHLAQKDPWVKESAVRQLEKSLVAAGRKYQIHRYPETTHWFCESDRKEYNKQQSAIACERLISFLRK